ncbi:MAG: hypothetical protein ACI9CO_000547 [Candidatus Azotimanducaceae bacterium]|jgi:hypothetical protein
MNWIQIGSALMLTAMLFMLFPRAKAAIQQSPKGTSSDWMSFIMPMTVVILFIILLISLV